MNSILQDLAHPPTRHAMFVHLPIVLAMLGLPLALLAAILRNNLTLRWLTISWYSLLVIAALVTVNSGDHAQAALGALAADVDSVLNNHESMADKVWLFATATLVLSALGALKQPKIRATGAWLSVIAGAVTFGWVSQTANYGGTLVYRHGVGIPGPSPIQPDSLPAVAILQQNCSKCHNASRVAAEKSGRLDQTTREGLLKGGNTGPAIVPGKPEESLLITLIKADDPEDRMPPEPRDPLTPAQIAAIEQWIREGAVWSSGY